MDDPDALARLATRVENLEQRISALEHPSQTAASTPHSQAAGVAAHPTSGFSFAEAGGVFPVLGKAMLGIAGAYLLRAVAESGSFPKLVVVVLALVYAGTWLVWAARVPTEARLASTVYTATAALIFAPMFWELTTRFAFLPTAGAAAILTVFAVTAYALGWKRGLVSVVWITNIAVVVTTLALLIATRDLVPFILALLLMALTSEVAALRNRWLLLRPLMAAAADLAVWILLFIYTRPEGPPSEYKAIATPVLLALGCGLFLIYGVSIVLRTALLRQRIRFFEIVEPVIAFLLAAFCVLRLGGSAGSTVVGAFCLLSSAACYAVAYASFDRLAEQRNYHVYATWGGALFLAGCALILPQTLLALCLSMGAIVATVLGVRASRVTLDSTAWHISLPQPTHLDCWITPVAPW